MTFEEYTDILRQKLLTVALIVSEKDIPYGRQFVFCKDSEKSVVNVYYNKKGEYRVVWPAKKNSLLIDLQKIFAAWQNENQIFSNVWAGSDESGKGDFFGPLVVAAVAVNKVVAGDLAVAGVRDCKTLTDRKILELEPLIKDKAVGFSVLKLLPEYYNQRYAQLQNLNKLNASGHFHALKDIFDRFESIEGAVIDQFLSDDSLVRELKAAFPDKKILQHPRAESDVAVAAASVLARAEFLHSMSELADLAGVCELPKGSGTYQEGVARLIAGRQGREILSKLVKTHFACYHRI